MEPHYNRSIPSLVDKESVFALKYPSRIELTFLLHFQLLLSNILYVTEGTAVFGSIGDAYWFSCVTITTVGYGRYVPYTVPGSDHVSVIVNKDL